ncbi:phosphatidylserine decarboxylase family protein [Aeromonas caviae]|uniref:phosphatidylserine decarboxylase family protein n=1 Tax=Aeromonas caviae TaxID=648 RepID=UPI001378EC9F|nr:phosphatidylserine decarboxylase family protein [Aeromonas caviae]MCY9811592.1 phosphatidylserine decarboxylase family protein [Aeromonas caviae]MDH1839083.1 phosphatidylserine decarboxylase family protein [Aeromonas caviae]MDX7596378.1 phosphatidylserine decarboxylase family protein [Aeromonas caviae]MDX7680555.1 phosphatidylserine decarboxylase family protein [Aeromonas caviae]MDX7690480.1 phosphatidylserine decarboxylase family protein [Aeromonas caviae]
MNKAVDMRHPHAHAGGWVPRDQAHVARWVQRLRQAVTRQPRPLVAPIAGLKALVEQDPLLHQQAQGMFDEAWQHEHSTPLGQVQVRSFDEFLQLLNGIMTTAPEAYQDVQTQEPAGLIGFPINALLNWPMATAAGYDFFANALVNQQLRKILGYWDDFFTRRFCPGVRPVTAPDDDSVIANACESAPLQVVTGVRRQDAFWLKGQPYSLDNLLDFDPRAAAFEGGTLYQAFLSALSYHRWHSPVSGTVRSVKVVNGSYYLANRHQGFDSPVGPDPSAPNQSQPFLTAVATRALIFIEADNPKIGLMCVVPVGMAEVSSCEVTVQPGQRIAKGEQLGMFHFGGSTHCLLFRPGVELAFDFYGQQPGLEATNLRINTALARVK